eukprot:Tbor_TRINITY_DN5408_c0_g1::TRINITY_DN5408_c0_g1_i2::g.24432::m.24432/K08956/AFG3; AFG3 family protein
MIRSIRIHTTQCMPTSRQSQQFFFTSSLCSSYFSSPLTMPIIVTDSRRRYYSSSDVRNSGESTEIPFSPYTSLPSKNSIALYPGDVLWNETQRKEFYPLVDKVIQKVIDMFNMKVVRVGFPRSLTRSTPDGNDESDKDVKSNNSLDKDKNKDDKKGNGGDGEDDDDGDDDVDTVTPKVTKFVFATFIIAGSLYFLSCPTGDNVSWNDVLKVKDTLKRIDVYEHFTEFIFSKEPTVHVGLIEDDHTEFMMNGLLGANPDKSEDFSLVYRGIPICEQGLHLLSVVAWIVPFIFFPVFVGILTRSIAMTGASAEAGRSGSKIIDKNMFQVVNGSKTRFSDIAGMREAKQEISEIVDFLKFPDRYTKLGAKVPTGALLLGPPGTGKTLLAKAVAGEAGVAFIPVCGSDFVELYVGMGALRVRQLFEVAKKQRCIIYIDEIDAIGLKRSSGGHGEKQEQEHTLNELLTQLDGFGSSRGEVMILASSNVKQSALDPALIRPGRFDRLVHVDVPVIKERISIFKVHLCGIRLTEEEANEAENISSKAKGEINNDENIKSGSDKENFKTSKGKSKALVEDVTTKTLTIVTSTTEGARSEDDLLRTVDRAELRLERESIASLEEKIGLLSEKKRHLVEVYASRMSDLCPGFVGSDIANVCNEAAILAARENDKFVTIDHLERSIDRVIAGIEHRGRVLSSFEKNVVAHHEAGHAVAGWFLGRADPVMKVSIVPRGGSALGYAQFLPNENHLRTSNEIKDSICMTLGGRVAEHIFFNHLSTGASDDLRKVTKMAYSYVSKYDTRTSHHAPGTNATKYVKPFGSAISDMIDESAKELVDEMYQRTYDLLISRKKEMEILANHLMENESLCYADLVKYLGDRPSRPSDSKPTKEIAKALTSLCKPSSTSPEQDIGAISGVLAAAAVEATSDILTKIPQKIVKRICVPTVDLQSKSPKYDNPL